MLLFDLSYFYASLSDMGEQIHMAISKKTKQALQLELDWVGR